MQSNHFDSVILGTNQFGQGFVNAVEGTHRIALRILIAKNARRLWSRLGKWRALAMKRMAAAASALAYGETTPGTAVAVVAATCPSLSASRRQRQPRWLSGVVVFDPGTVGVC